MTQDQTGQSIPRITLDKNDLYLEEPFTDAKVGTIRRLTPVHLSGDHDSSRQVRFVGQTQLVTSQGMVPVQFEIKATTLEQAVDAFPNVAHQAIHAMLEQARKERMAGAAGK